MKGIETCLALCDFMGEQKLSLMKPFQVLEQQVVELIVVSRSCLLSMLCKYNIVFETLCDSVSLRSKASFPRATVGLGHSGGFSACFKYLRSAIS